MTNKEFANDFISFAKKIIEDLAEINDNDPAAAIKIAKAQEKNAAIKQANNSFRSCLQHDVAKAKIDGYKSSFLDEDQ